MKVTDETSTVIIGARIEFELGDNSYDLYKKLGNMAPSYSVTIRDGALVLLQP